MTGSGSGPAERARTTLAACPLPEVTAYGLTALVPDHAVDTLARPVLLVRDDSELAGVLAGSVGDVPVRLRAVALRPLQVADRVRATVELHGRLDVVAPAEHLAAANLLGAGAVPPEHSLLRIRPGHVALDGELVDLDAFRLAAPDPFARDEATLLRRLLGDHPEAVAALCGLLDPDAVAQATEIAPSGLDRHGLTFLVTGPDGPRELRIPFPAAVQSVTTLEATLRALLLVARTRTRPT